MFDVPSAVLALRRDDALDGVTDAVRSVLLSLQAA